MMKCPYLPINLWYFLAILVVPIYYCTQTVLAYKMSSCQCNCDHHHDHDHHHKPMILIKNPKSGLVLDASDYEVKVQNYNGNASQLWTLQCSEHGKFIITNKGNGKVLDIQGGAKNGAHLITYDRHGGTNQQWYINSNHTIVSAADNLAVDIKQGKLCAGTHLIAYKTHGKDNQIFHLHDHHHHH